MQRLCVIFLTILFFSSWGMGDAASQDREPKKLAPGVLKTIPVQLDPRDSYSLPMPMPLLEVAPYETKYLSPKDTLYAKSRRDILYRNVWENEFSFLGLRQARLLVPNAKTGLPERKNVWYLVYRIRDPGKTLTYKSVKQNPDFEHMKQELQYDVEIPDDEKFFLPRFTLEGWVLNKAGDGYEKVVYPDRVSPMVLRQIQRLEDPAIPLLDPVAMSHTKIPKAKNDADPGVWGAAVFEDVDPRLDYVSVFVSGLTNAYRLGKDTEGPNLRKTLQLNFWRPGDIVAEENDTIDYGIPLVDDPKRQVLITKRYNLPGPVIRGYHVNRDAANRSVLVAEEDAKVNLNDFKSELVPVLDGGKIPDSVIQAFERAGIKIDPETKVETVVPGKRWSFTNQGETYFLVLEPQFWEPFRGGIRFIKSLDHFWIYR